MIRREMFEHLGGWDQGFLAGGEDFDLSIRAWMKGWKSIYVPDATCWHRVGVSERTAEGAAARARGGFEGRLRLAAKHATPGRLLLTIGMSVAGTVFQLGRGHLAVAGFRMRILVKMILATPSFVGYRRRSRRSATMSRRELWSFLRSL